MKLAFVFCDGMTALDMIGAHEVLCRLPGAEPLHVAKSAGPVRTDAGVVFDVPTGFGEVQTADFLLIPGAASATSMRDDLETLAWVRAIHATTRWTTSEALVR